MSPILSLSDAGYRRFGSLPATGGGLTPERAAGIAGLFADYEVAGQLVRRRARRKGACPVVSLRLTETFDRDSTLDNDCLDFIDAYFRSEFATSGVPELTAEQDTLVSAIKDASRERRCLGVRYLADALGYAGPHRLKSILRDHVAPAFFKLYPQGKIAVVRYDAHNDNAAALMRMFYAAAQTPLPDLQQGGFAGIRTLQDWHLNSVTMLGPVLFQLFFHLFYPFIGGFRGGPPGLDFVFLFEPAESYELDVYPRNWLAVGSTTAGFGRQDFDLYASLREFQGAAGRQAAHQRFLHDRGYTVAQRLTLLGWYVEQANRLLYELTDVANFTEGQAPDGHIDPVFAFEHHMTLDRLARKTLLAMTLEEAGTAKFMAFEVAELYDTLSHLFQGTGSTDFFKDLFHPANAPALLRPQLARLPEPFRTDLPALADRLYHTIQETVVRSVWLRAKVTATDVLVRDRNLTREAPVPHADFVAELMRCYRNCHHGYFTANDRQARPSRYLYLADGNLPAELSALPALWWLAYLADPELVGWRPLPVGRFEG